MCFLLCTGEEKPYRSKGFSEFTQLCVLAYRILRRHANLLLLSLLAMMLPSGLQELTSLADLEYVRKTLALDAWSRGSASGGVGDDDDGGEGGGELLQRQVQRGLQRGVDNQDRLVRALGAQLMLRGVCCEMNCLHSLSVCVSCRFWCGKDEWETRP